MKHEFNLGYVYYFLDVVETGSISRSAERLHITQPTLSNAIATLERELDVQLFDRVGKNRIVLNRFGELLRQKASLAFFTLDQAAEELTDMKESASSQVRFSLPSPAAFSSTISRFTAEHPAASLRQSNTDLQYAYRQLMDGALDFAVSYLPHPAPEFEWHPFRREPLSVTFAEDHPLMDEPEISAAQLAQFPIVLCTDNNLFPDLCAGLFERAAVSPRYQYIGPDPRIAARCVLQDHAVSVICPIDSAPLICELSSPAAAVSLPIPCLGETCELGIVTRKGHFLSRAARELIEMLRSDWGNLDAPIN